MSPKEEVEAALAKYGSMEVALTLTAQELTDVASMVYVSASLIDSSKLPEAVITFLEGAEEILKSLLDAMESGEEIVSL